jgi:hypothetical protein
MEKARDYSSARASAATAIMARCAQSLRQQGKSRVSRVLTSARGSDQLLYSAGYLVRRINVAAGQ